MRTLRSHLHNIGPFQDFVLDVDGCEGTVIAVKAPNGSGKTCALEMAWLGTCYRDTATQGSLLERATDRDAFLESEVEAEDGQIYTIRHEADPVARSSETVVVRKGETEPLWKGTKVSAFDKWAELHLLPQDVLTSTVFAVQGANGFIGLGSAARISVILKAIGVARIERMAELARAGKKKTETELQTLGVRIGDVRNTLPDVEELTKKREELETRVESLSEELALKQGELDAAKATSADSVLAQQRYAELKRARDVLVAKVDSWRSDLRAYESDLAKCKPDDLRAALLTLESRQRDAKQALDEATALASELRSKREAASQRTLDRNRTALALRTAKDRLASIAQKIANNQYVIDHADELRKALARAEELRTEIQRLEVEQTRLRGEIERHGLAEKQHDVDRRRHQEAADESDRRVAKANEALKNRAAVDEASVKLEASRTAAEEAEYSVTVARDRLNELRDTTIAGAEKRIDNLRGSLVAIRENERPGHEQDMARESIATDDRIVELAQEHPRLVAEAQATLETREEELRLALARLREIEQLNAQAPVIRAAEEELTAATSELTRSQAAATEADAMAQEEHRVSLDAANAWKTATLTLEAHRAELVGLEPELKKAAALTGAEERIAEYTPQLEAERTEEKRLTDELAALPELLPVPADPDIPDLTKDHNDAVHAAQEANSALVRCEATKAQLVPQVERHRSELAKLEQELAGTPEPVPPDQVPQLEALEEALQTVRDAYDEALRDFSATETRITQASEQQQRIETLEQEARALEMELADWTRLALDLGRDGIQSAEVDSAGPELTELTNDLLLTCHGSRYSVSIETAHTKANGKGATDECRVMVRDANDNSEREARLHSGGECVVLGEAVSLALTMMACRRSGVQGATLVRDESGAALDPQNARVYLDMLRHAAKVTHAPKVLFVSHSEDVQRMADSVLEIRGAA